MFRAALFSLVLLLPAYCADLTGKWTGKRPVSGREIPATLEVVQNGDTLTGVFGGRADFLWTIHNGKASGSAFSFDLQLPAGPSLSVSGTVDGDRMSAELKSEAAPAMAGAFEMQRVGPPTKVVAGARSAADLSALSDEFSDAKSLSQWRNLSDAEGYPNRIEKAAVAGGELQITPNSGAWYGGYHGVYFFKEVDGDFSVTTRLRVSGRNLEQPSQVWTISGLLARVPGRREVAADHRRENWIYVMTGRGPAEARVIDAKSTLDNSNMWDISPASAGWYELRLVRIGSLFVALCHPDGAEWSVRKKIVREDLPAALQVGINVTSDFKLSTTMPAEKYNAALFPGKHAPDNFTTFDYVRFANVSSEAAKALAGRAIVGIADEELLKALK